MDGFFVRARGLVTTPVEGVPSPDRLSGRLIDARDPHCWAQDVLQKRGRPIAALASLDILRRAP